MLHELRPYCIDQTQKKLITKDGTKFDIVGNGVLKVQKVHTKKIHGNALIFDGNCALVWDPSFLPSGSTITLDFWLCVDEALTDAGSVIHATSDEKDDTDTNRVLNIMIPDKNQITFTAGDKNDPESTVCFAADSNDILQGQKGQFIHWVFSKNADTGIMAICRNGVVRHIEQKKTTPLAKAAKLTIGGFTLSDGTISYPFIGKIAKLSITTDFHSSAFRLEPASIENGELKDKDKNKYPITGTPPVLDQDKYFGECLRFQNTPPHQPGFVTLPNDRFFTGGFFTIAFWVKFPRISGRYSSNTVIQANIDPNKPVYDADGYIAASNRVFDIHLPYSDTSDYRLIFHCGNDGKKLDAYSNPISEEDLAPDCWTHWAFTKDVHAGKMQVYRNGVPWPEPLPDATPCPNPMGTPGIISLGSATDGSAPFQGTIARLSVFGSVLSQKEILDLLLEPVTGISNSPHPSEK